MTTRARRQSPTPRGAQPLPSRSTCALVPVVVAGGSGDVFPGTNVRNRITQASAPRLGNRPVAIHPMRNLLPHFGDHCALDPLALFNACRSPRARFLLSYIRGIGKRSAAQAMQSSQHRAPRRSEPLSDLRSRKTLRFQPPQPPSPDVSGARQHFVFVPQPESCGAAKSTNDVSEVLDGPPFRAVFVAVKGPGNSAHNGGWCLAQQLAQLHSFDLYVRRMDDLAPFGRILP
jgi:hypothetical protein